MIRVSMPIVVWLISMALAFIAGLVVQHLRGRR